MPETLTKPLSDYEHAEALEAAEIADATEAVLDDAALALALALAEGEGPWSAEPSWQWPAEQSWSSASVLADEELAGRLGAEEGATAATFRGVHRATAPAYTTPTGLVQIGAAAYSPRECGSAHGGHA